MGSIAIDEAKLGSHVRSGPVHHINDNSALDIIFARQASKYPDKVVLVYESHRMTYAELNVASDYVATQIAQNLGGLRKPDAVIALCLERSDLTVIAILAALKAGVAYVALDPKYPADRIHFILQDTRAVTLVTDDSTAIQWDEFMPSSRLVKVTRGEWLTRGPVAPPVTIGTTNQHLSHVLYTSGTTGRPKGVMVTREALITDSIDYQGRYGFAPGDDEVVVYFLNYVFNAATVPFLTALSNGFPLVVVRPSMLFETEKFYDYLSSNGVTHIDGTPSLVARLDLTRLPALKRIAIGGEPLTPEAFRHFKAFAPHVAVVNIFGNSEGTMCVQHETVEKESDCRIFRNVTTNKRCYVINWANEPATVGDIGEMAVSGSGLARGYLNNEPLTREKFVPNPFQTAEDRATGSHVTLFKTGDLFRILPGGGFLSVGRTDHQVKLRGYRIELGEIESVIRSYPGVTQSVVVKHGDTSEQATLIGYYVATPGQLALEREILRHVSKILPSYMVPAKLLRLAEMPLNFNGKIDRNQLPVHHSITPIVSDSSEGRPEVLSNSPDLALNTLITIWRDILNLDPTEDYTVDADFFETGGNSLLAMRLVERVSTEMGINVDAAHVFRFSTISEFFENLPV